MIDAAKVDISMVKFDDKGLVPAVVQEENGQVLMLAYMNEEALKKTLETGYAHYFSRSRQTLWKKGETSGNVQQIKEISYDCDGDTLLMRVHQTGVACHTGSYSCFSGRTLVSTEEKGIAGGNQPEDLPCHQSLFLGYKTLLDFGKCTGRQGDGRKRRTAVRYGGHLAYVEAQRRGAAGGAWRTGRPGSGDSL